MMKPTAYSGRQTASPIPRFALQYLITGAIESGDYASAARHLDMLLRRWPDRLIWFCPSCRSCWLRKLPTYNHTPRRSPRGILLERRVLSPAAQRLQCSAAVTAVRGAVPSLEITAFLVIPVCPEPLSCSLSMANDGGGSRCPLQRVASAKPRLWLCTWRATSCTGHSISLERLCDDAQSRSAVLTLPLF